MTSNKPNEKSNSIPKSVIDPTLINAYIQAIDPDSPEIVLEIVDLLAKDIPERLSEMSQAIQNNDMDTLMRAAHTLKGEVSHFGAQELVSLCQQIELEAKNNQADNLEETFTSIQNAVDALLCALVDFRLAISNDKYSSNLQ